MYLNIVVSSRTVQSSEVLGPLQLVQVVLDGGQRVGVLHHLLVQ